MSENGSLCQVIPIAEDFFCDGHYYVLTSSALGGAAIAPRELSDLLRSGEAAEITKLLREGICIPLFFDGDCALDGNTLFVLGDLTTEEEANWIGLLSWKLRIPCGKFVILCGGGTEEDITEAISGNPPNPDAVTFQAIDVVPGDYLVEIYAFLSSMTVQQSLEKYMGRGIWQENRVLRDWYEANCGGLPDLDYVIRLVPLTVEPPFPELVPDIDWCGVFSFRHPEL
jgi:hypothetical protein